MGLFLYYLEYMKKSGFACVFSIVDIDSQTPNKFIVYDK